MVNKPGKKKINIFQNKYFQYKGKNYNPHFTPKVLYILSMVLGIGGIFFLFWGCSSVGSVNSVPVVYPYNINKPHINTLHFTFSEKGQCIISMEDLLNIYSNWNKIMHYAHQYHLKANFYEHYFDRLTGKDSSLYKNKKIDP